MSAESPDAKLIGRQAVIGDWVEIVRTVFAPEERLAATPDDTRSLPYEARIRGFARSAGWIGDEMTIKTRIGRVVTGTLIDVDPAFGHGFGRSVPELLWIGPELRARLFLTAPDESKSPPK